MSLSIHLFIPEKIKILLHQYIVQKKFDVILKKNATAYHTIFEGKNLININANCIHSEIGLGTYISGNSKIRKAKIGKFCCIGQNVETGFGIHPIDSVSMHPAFYSLNKQAGFTFTDKQLFNEHHFVDQNNRYFVEIGHDVWIGNDVKILDGVKIGDGAVIALGAVVTKDVEPYSIVGGSPAKLIKYRFDHDTIQKLKTIEIWNHEFDWYKENWNLFQNVQLIIENYDLRSSNKK